MNSKRRNQNPPVERDHIDPTGVPVRVLVPEGFTDLNAGIPVSLDVSQLYTHMPHDFVVEFTAALHVQGLVKPEDYFKPGASDKYKQALLMVIRNDFLTLQAKAKEELDGLK